MNYTRWYDKDNYTKLLITTLEQVGDNIQNDLSNDLIQLIMQSGVFTSLDKLIDEINEPYIPVRRRWYDKNETVHSAVSLVKYLAQNIGKKAKTDILEEFFYSLISYNNGNPKLLEVKS
jgi:hypothetical protein